MAYEFTQLRTVEFAETDAAGYLHFSNFFRYMEMTEHAFYRSLGGSITDDLAAGVPVWPRAHAECSYRRPLRAEDRVEIQLLVREKTESRIDYGFVFRDPDDPEQATIAIGGVRVACAARDADGRLHKHVIPPKIAGRIDAAPAQLLAIFRW